MMGMFDYLRCEAPLPVPPEVTADEARGFEYQTKDLVNALDRFTITADGKLIGEEYEIEDRSDPNAEGLARLIGCMTKVNERKKPWDDFTGEVCFYAHYGQKNDCGWGIHWIEFSAYFIKGQMQSVTLVEHRRAAA